MPRQRNTREPAPRTADTPVSNEPLTVAEQNREMTRALKVLNGEEVDPEVLRDRRNRILKANLEQKYHDLLIATFDESRREELFGEIDYWETIIPGFDYRNPSTVEPSYTGRDWTDEEDEYEEAEG